MPFNPSQKLNEPRPGAPMRAQDTGHVIAAMKRMIVQGVGISVQWLGDQCLISAKGGPVGGFSGGGGVKVHKGVNVAAFPDPATVDEGDFARVTGNDGDPIGSMYVVSPDKSAWVSFTHFG